MRGGNPFLLSHRLPPPIMHQISPQFLPPSSVLSSGALLQCGAGAVKESNASHFPTVLQTPTNTFHDFPRFPFIPKWRR
ncbi:hypothetical protein ACFX19_023267 [Malus domestica]